MNEKIFLVPRLLNVSKVQLVCLPKLDTFMNDGIIFFPVKWYFLQFDYYHCGPYI